LYGRAAGRRNRNGSHPWEEQRETETGRIMAPVVLGCLFLAEQGSCLEKQSTSCPTLSEKLLWDSQRQELFISVV